MADIFVLVDGDVALAAFDDEGNDLVGEPPGLLCRFGLVLRGEREGVLLFTAELPLAGDVFGGDAHVIAVEGVGQTVLDHRVDHLEIAHLHAAAKMRAMRRHRHGLHAAGDDDIRITGCNLLHAERHGTKTGTAELVHAPGGFLLRKTRLHRRLTRRVLALAGLQDLAEDHLVDLACLDACALEHALDDGGAEFVRRCVGECTVEGSDRGTGGAGDHDGGIAHGTFPQIFLA
ncbi:hypothetical protein D9M72_439210 [compost metagenome]